MTLYEACGQAFVGCPGDAEPFQELVQQIWAELPVPGLKPVLIHWKKDFDAHASTSAVPAQFHIARTSDPATNPVFILFAQTIGTAVRPPPEGWSGLRHWLDSNGWPFIALLGKADFQDASEVPEGKIPLSGTMYEMFDAMRSGAETELIIYDLRKLLEIEIATSDVVGHQQKTWLDRLLASLQQNHIVRVPNSEAEFRQLAEDDLRRAFDLPLFDPANDPLPGLEALSRHDPLLFGRGDLIGRLTTHIFLGPDACNLVLGASGAGKSSLLRAGLMHSWYRHSPLGAGRRYSAHALLVEPRLLQLEPDDDPLVILARLLRRPSGADEPRIMGPYPGPLGTLVPDPPALQGDLTVDLSVCLDWWRSLTARLSGPLILILDQAEQIEEIARETSQSESDRTGRDVEPALSPSWLRFTGLLGLLTGTLNPKIMTARLQDERARLAETPCPVRLILGLHREDALNLWPLDHAMLPAAHIIPPISDEADFRDIIRGTLHAYGLSIAPALLEKMVSEAGRLAKEQIDISAPADLRATFEPGAASIMPQLKTTLQRIMTRWLDRTNGGSAQPDASRVLDLDGYADLADIHGSIDALGESAWSMWQADLSARLGKNVASYFGRQELEADQWRRFGDLMSGLIDTRDQERQGLTYLRRQGPRAQRNGDLVDVLRRHRLLTSADRDWLRLPHRTILDHWKRARSWTDGIARRLSAKRRLASYHNLGWDADRWSAEDSTAFADLVLDWIGNGEGLDSDLQDYGRTGLVARFDPSDDIHETLGAPTLLVRALAMGEDALLARLLTKCIQAPNWSSLVGSVATIFSEMGLAQHLRTISDSQPADSQWVNAVMATNGCFPLLQAAQLGHTEIVELLLRAGANPHQVHQTDATFPLLQAARNGHAEIVAALLDAGAAIDRSSTQDGQFPMLAAARGGHLDVVELLIKRGADISQQCGAKGSFPLYEAAGRGHATVVERLLRAGADANQINHDKDGTPILVATVGASAEVVRLLIGAGAVLDRPQAGTGATALLVASSRGQGDIVGLLLDAGAKPNQINACQGDFPLLRATEAANVATVDELIKAGADPNQINAESGARPLFVAANFGHLDLVRSLLAAGANPNLPSPKLGSFPLQVAAQNRHIEVARALLQAGADPNQIDAIRAVSPLAIAAQEGVAKIVALLLAHGARPNMATTPNGNFPLLAAMTNDNLPSVELLLAAGADPNQVNADNGSFPLLVAANLGLIDAVSLLLRSGASPLQVSPVHGTFPILVAAASGHSEVIRLLASAGAPIDQISRGRFPLLEAANEGRVEAIETLLALDAPIDQVSPESGAFFPLFAAVGRGQLGAVRALLAAGADPKMFNTTFGVDSLALAVEQGFSEIVEALLAEGAPPDRVDPNGYFPLLSAAHHGHEAIIKLLIAAGARPDQARADGVFPLLAAVNQARTGAARLLLEAGANPNRERSQDGMFPLLLAANRGDIKTVDVLLEKGAHPSQRHRDTGASPLSTAVSAKRSRVVQRLLEEKGFAETLAADVLAAAIEAAALSHVDEPPVQESRSPGMDLSTALPCPGFWQTIEDLDKTSGDYEEIIIILETLKFTELTGFFGTNSLEIRSDGHVWLKRMLFSLHVEAENVMCDVHWISTNGTLPPILLEPGTPLDAILISFAEHGISLSLRAKDAAQIWAAVLLLTADPPLAPLLPSGPLPIGSESDISRIEFPESYWRLWHHGAGPEGPNITLSWIAGDELIRGRIVVTIDGIGSRILETTRVIARDVAWVLPKHLLDARGGHLGVRALGLLEPQEQPLAD